MAKPVVTLRKPPEPPDVETFVRGERPNVRAVKRPDVQASKRPSAQTSKAVVHRADGRELRRMTVYLPTDLAAKLRVHCAGADIDLSAFVAEAVAGRLGA